MIDAMEITCDGLACNILIISVGYKSGSGIDVFCSERCARYNFERFLKEVTVDELLKDEDLIFWQKQKKKASE